VRVFGIAPGLLLLTSPGSKAASPDLPEYAHISHGFHWKCDRGFRRVEDECQAVQVPEHAYLNYSGHDWSCEGDFRRLRDRCTR
jgi:hypothetical protein